LDISHDSHRRILVFSRGAQKLSCSSQGIVRAEGIKVMFFVHFSLLLFSI